MPFFIHCYVAVINPENSEGKNPVTHRFLFVFGALQQIRVETIQKFNFLWNDCKNPVVISIIRNRVLL